MLKNIIMMERRPFTHLLSACLLSCIRVAASRMQIVTGCQSPANFPSVDFIHVACDWRPRGYSLHALATSCMQSRQFFCKHAARTIIWIKKWRRHDLTGTAAFLFYRICFSWQNARWFGTCSQWCCDFCKWGFCFFNMKSGCEFSAPLERVPRQLLGNWAITKLCFFRLFISLIAELWES